MGSDLPQVSFSPDGTGRIRIPSRSLASSENRWAYEGVASNSLIHLEGALRRIGAPYKDGYFLEVPEGFDRWIGPKNSSRPRLACKYEWTPDDPNGANSAWYPAYLEWTEAVPESKNGPPPWDPYIVIPTAGLKLRIQLPAGKVPPPLGIWDGCPCFDNTYKIDDETYEIAEHDDTEIAEHDDTEIAVHDRATRFAETLWLCPPAHAQASVDANEQSFLEIGWNSHV